MLLFILIRPHSSFFTSIVYVPAFNIFLKLLSFLPLADPVSPSFLFLVMSFVARASLPLSFLPLSSSLYPLFSPLLCLLFPLL